MYVYFRTNLLLLSEVSGIVIAKTGNIPVLAFSTRYDINTDSIDGQEGSSMKKIIRYAVSMMTACIMVLAVMPLQANAADYSITVTPANTSGGAVLSAPVNNVFTLTDNGKTAEIIVTNGPDQMAVTDQSFTYSETSSSPSIGIAFITTPETGYKYVVKTNDGSTWQLGTETIHLINSTTVDCLKTNVPITGGTTIQLSIEKLNNVTLAVQTGSISFTGTQSAGTTYTFHDSSSAKTADLMIQDSTHQNVYSTGTTFEAAGKMQLTFSNVAGGTTVIVSFDGASYLASYDDYNQSYFCNINFNKSGTADIQFIKGFTVTLPAEYNAAYLTNYGTVEYSDSENGTFLPISQGTIATKTEIINFQNGELLTFYNYTFQNENTRYIKAVLPTANPLGLTAIEALGLMQGSDMVENGTLDNGEVKKLLGGGNIQYDNWYTISWSYDEASKLSPAYEVFKHGKIIITAINGDPNFKDKFGQPAIQSDGSGTTGLAMLQPNSKVTIKFVPDAGYQFAGFEINGQPITEGIYVEDELYTYTFDIHNQLHFTSNFIEGTDIVTNNSDHVQSASIENGAAGVGSGNAELDVEDAAVEESIKLQMQTAAGTGSTIQTVLGLTVNQYIAKGTVITKDNLSSKTAWIIQKTDLEEKVKVSIVLDEGVVPEGAAVSVVRKHGDTIAAIPATYDAATRTLSFVTDKFSEYAVATSPKAAAVSTASTATETKDSASPATGSASNLMLYGFLLFTSITAVCISIRRLRLYRR